MGTPVCFACWIFDGPFAGQYHHYKRRINVSIHSGCLSFSPFFSRECRSRFRVSKGGTWCPPCRVSASPEESSRNWWTTSSPTDAAVRCSLTARVNPGGPREWRWNDQLHNIAYMHTYIYTTYWYIQYAHFMSCITPSTLKSEAYSQIIKFDVAGQGENSLCSSVIDFEDFVRSLFVENALHEDCWFIVVL